MELHEVIAAIFAGTFDEDIRTLQEALHNRREKLGQARFNKLEVGSLVRFNEHVRPKYLVGAIAVVDAKKEKRVVVKLGEDAGRFTKGVPINTYPEVLDVIDRFPRMESDSQ